MATNAFFLRPSTILSTISSARRSLVFFSHPAFFSLPSSPSSLAPRISRNIAAFSAHYSLLLYLSLLASLFPAHRSAMLSLMLLSKVLLSYAALLRVFPNNIRLRRVLNPRVVGAVFVAVVVVLLALAEAVGRLFVAGAVVAPIVAAHAVFRTAEVSVGSESGKVEGEGLPISGGGGEDPDRSA